MLFVDVERFSPGLAAVGGHENATLVVWSKCVAHCTNVHHLWILWVADDRRDVLGVLESGMLPALAAVSGFVNAVAERNTVAGVRFTGADPDNVGISWLNSDISNRNCALSFKDRFPRKSTIRGLPESARSRSDIDNIRITGYALHVRYAPAHICWSNAAPLEPLKGLFKR